MGKYKKGILGAFSGKVGTVIGSSWNWIDYICILCTKPLRPLRLKIASKLTRHASRFNTMPLISFRFLIFVSYNVG